jgi:hypothetical protein
MVRKGSPDAEVTQIAGQLEKEWVSGQLYYLAQSNRMIL